MRRAFSILPVLFALIAAPGSAQIVNHDKDGAYRTTQHCMSCHDFREVFETSHHNTMHGPDGILTTRINGETVSVFDPRTPGYDRYIAPFAAFFNPGNVVYTVGGRGWAQRFATRIVPEAGTPAAAGRTAVLSDNDIVLMGAQWNQRKGRWEDYHGPLGDNDWVNISFNTKCGSCHATGFRPRDGTRIDRWAESRVGCEACHGPSNNINPKTLDAAQANQMCGSCHNRGQSQTDHFDYPYNARLGGTWQPGRDLTQYFNQFAPPAANFWPDGESKLHHQQFPDFQLSRHAEVGLRCTDCHSHHRNDYPGQLRDTQIATCLACHGDKLLNSSDRYEHSKHTDRQAGCADCHMPRTAQAVEPGDIRSHTFFFIEPQKTREFGIPSGCVTCHTEGPGQPKADAEMDRAYREISPSFRESVLVPVVPAENRWSGFALANVGAETARLFFTIFDPAGKLMSAAGLQNPKAVSLPPGRQMSYVLDQFFGDSMAGRAGWVRLNHYRPDLKGFYLEGDQAGTELTGLTADGSLGQAWATPVLWPGSENRLTLTNPSTRDAGVVLTPVGPSGEQAGSPWTTAIAAHGRSSFVFREVFSGLPAGGYIRVQSNVDLEGQVTALQGKTLATVRLFSPGRGANSLTVPHVVLGDGWDTRLVVYNPTDHDVEIQLDMRRDGGTSVPYGGIARRTLRAGAMLNESLSAFVPPSGSRIEGYLLVRTANSSDTIQGAVAFGSLAGGVAALAVESAGRKQITFSHVAQGNGYWTGLALLAPAGGSAVVELKDTNGDTVVSREVALSGRRVSTIGQLLAVAKASGGYLVVRANTNLFAFEVFGNDQSTILAAVPPQ